jgi:hypothetical protein
MCDSRGVMNPLLFNLGFYSRLTLLLLMLAAQGIAVAHENGDSHELKSHSCSTCIVGHGLGVAIGASSDTPPVQVYQAFSPINPVATTLASRVNCHHTRAPPAFSWNT